MDKAYVPAALAEAHALSVRIDEHWHVASLRYFDGEGDFARSVANILGHSLPEALRISAAGALTEGGSLLAWRSPTESLLLCDDIDRVRSITAADGCCVNQTGGRRVLRIEGTRGTDLLARLGGAALDPPVGGARSGRFADIPALTLRLSDELLLVVVDRVYAEHLQRWVEMTVRDLR